MTSPTNTAPRDQAGTTSPANDRDSDTAAATLSVRRLNLMRLGYLVMGAGIAVTKWPLLLDRNEPRRPPAVDR